MDISPDTILITRRLTLRFPKLSDAAGIFSVVKSARFPEQLPLKELESVAEIEAWLKGLQESRARGRVFSWIAEESASGRLAGQVTLAKTAGDQVWALAFWTHPDQWGKGYATEGAERVLAFGFEEAGAKKIWAGAGEWNKTSQRVLEKIGLQEIGRNPQGYFSRGVPIPTREYEITRETWEDRT